MKTNAVLATFDLAGDRVMSCASTRSIQDLRAGVGRAKIGATAGAGVQDAMARGDRKGIGSAVVPGNAL
jgi:hypothetical protein